MEKEINGHEDSCESSSVSDNEEHITTGSDSHESSDNISLREEKVKDVANLLEVTVCENIDDSEEQSSNENDSRDPLEVDSSDEKGNDTERTSNQHHRSDKRFQCTCCAKKFTRNAHLTTHMRIHRSERPYLCAVCDKSFTTRSTLIAHVRTHTGVKPYKCTECNQKFAQNSTLKHHFKRHHTYREPKPRKPRRQKTDDIGPHKCEQCDKVYETKQKLRVHRYSHSTEKYVCPLCSKRFTAGGTLKSHLRIHSGEKPFECEICMKSFTNNSNLQAHYRIHTGEKRFQCPTCNKKWAKKISLRTHVCLPVDGTISTT
ncbi:Zinc finger protein 182 [Frankliniella fusca]|uniref:Zinc finger protein 182 n=1 Tax=Frankliniella fusca TaxID=407009 RepID=A0AAE1HSZ3_9NEOP|nr:Zinc finger protein 182 [Frankliniella fusca]